MQRRIRLLAIFFVLVLVVMAFMKVSVAQTQEILGNHQVTTVSQQALLNKLADEKEAPSFVLIDVRTAFEYRLGHIPSAVHLPHQDILNDVTLLDPYKEVQMIFYCQSGVRAGKVLEKLMALGYDNLAHLEGDYGRWKANDLPVD